VFRVNENTLSMRWNNKAWSVLESGLRGYQSWDSSWWSYVKPDLKLRGIPAASTISVLRTIVKIFSQKEWQGLVRLPFLYFRPCPACGPPCPCRVLLHSVTDQASLQMTILQCRWPDIIADDHTTKCRWPSIITYINQNSINESEFLKLPK